MKMRAKLKKLKARQKRFDDTPLVIKARHHMTVRPGSVKK